MAVTTEASTGKYLLTAKVAERYGRTPRTIERWLDDKKLNFPQPIYINPHSPHEALISATRVAIQI
jgi:hypothetical protein